MTRSMMKAKGLSRMFWAEAEATAIYVLNQSPTKRGIGMTPYEAWYGKKSAMHHLCTFSYVAYVKETSPNLKKMDDGSHAMIFMGYESDTKGYQIYDPSTRQVCVSHNVVFDEHAQWSWKKDDGVGVEMEQTFTIDYSVPRESTMAEGTAEENGRGRGPSECLVPATGGGDRGLTDGDREPSRRSSVASSYLDVDHSVHVHARMRRLDDVIADL
jgi:hypothetical protein